MNGSPQIAVDIYPFEGGSFQLIGGQVLSAEVRKPLRDTGTATIILAPGGPNGQGWPSWGQVITLQSLVVIAQSRGSYANVDFVGVVVRTAEQQVWENGVRVTRTTTIECMDWQEWFVAFNWTALSWLAAVNGNATAFSTNLPPQLGIPAVYFAGQSAMNPSQIASGWLGIMGDDFGVLAKTKLQYGSSTVRWPDATTAYFENYPYNPTFPASMFYVSNEGSWWSKFSSILEFPFYELIVGTAPQGLWNGTGASGAISSPGQIFNSQTMPGATPAQAQLVGRVNPLPDLNLSGATQSTQQLSVQTAQVLTSANLDRWNALPAFTADEGFNSFIASQTSNSLGEYANFVFLQPVNVQQALGLTLNGIQIFSFSGAADIAGIHRYGLIDRTWSSMWYADPTKQVMQGPPQSTQDNLTKLMNALTARLATYFMPTPLMESATVTLPLRPDIFPGCRFTYSPYRGDFPWMFYITGVTHSYNFGGPSTTTLNLSRGLPISIYSNSDQMYQLLLGNLQRQDGGFVSRIAAQPAPAGTVSVENSSSFNAVGISPTASSAGGYSSDPGLQIFGMAGDSLQSVLAQIAKAYATPGH